jgi:hypothetical protein
MAVGEKRTRTLLFVVDTSSGMNYGGTDTVNSAIESVISSIKNASDEYPELNVLFKVATLEFWGENATISTPEDITSYKWKNLEAKDSTSKFSVACKKLNEILAGGGVIADGSYLAIILIACPEIDIDGPVALNELKRNSRFKQAYRVAIGVGNFQNMKVLEEYTDNGVDFGLPYGVVIDADSCRDMKVLEEFTDNEVNVVDLSMPRYIYNAIRNMSLWAAQFGLRDGKFVQLLLKDSKDGWKWGTTWAL